MKSGKLRHIAVAVADSDWLTIIAHTNSFFVK